MSETVLAICFGGFTIAVVVISLEMWRVKMQLRRVSHVAAVQRRARAKCGEIMRLLLDNQKDRAMAEIKKLAVLEREVNP